MTSLTEVRYDGYVYETEDPIFAASIENGQIEPYLVDLAIVDKYVTMFPHKNRAYVDVGAHIGTTLMPYSELYQRLVGFEPNPHNFILLKTNTVKNGL